MGRGGLYNRGTTVLSGLIRWVASGGGGLYNRGTTVLSDLIRWVASGGEGGFIIGALLYYLT